MSWARFDDRYDDNRKIKRAWRRDGRAVGLHAMAITYASRHETDGIIDIDWLEEKLPQAAQRKRTLAALQDAGLLERIDDQYFRVHDYVKYNPTHAELEEKRRADAARKADARRRGHQKASGAESARTDAGKGAESQNPGANASGSPIPSPPNPAKEKSSPNGELAEPAVIRRVFEYWQERCHHPQAILTEDRRAKIRARLRDGYTEDQIRTAINGAAKAPYVNETGVHDDLELICRNGSKLESFIKRTKPHRNGRREEHDDTNERIAEAEK